MKPIDQTIFDKGKGDCQRAVIASLLDLNIEKVPNFRLYKNWFKIYYNFLYKYGYKWEGTGYFPKFTPKSEHLKEFHINGYVESVVPSKNYPLSENINHSVVMDLNGLVIHDPHPKKDYQNINIIETQELKYWSLIKKIK